MQIGICRNQKSDQIIDSKKLCFFSVINISNLLEFNRELKISLKSLPLME